MTRVLASRLQILAHLMIKSSSNKKNSYKCFTNIHIKTSLIKCLCAENCYKIIINHDFRYFRLLMSVENGSIQTSTSAGKWYSSSMVKFKRVNKMVSTSFNSGRILHSSFTPNFNIHYIIQALQRCLITFISWRNLVEGWTIAKTLLKQQKQALREPDRSPTQSELSSVPT